MRRLVILTLRARGLFADVESLIDGAVTYLEGQVTTLESQINGVGLTADDYDTLVEIGAALTTLNAAAAVTGSVSEKIATEIGTASTGWNSTTGNFDTAGTGLFADVESLIDGAVTYLEGKVTTLESQINGVGLTADDYDTLVEIGAALTTLNAAAAVTGSVSEKIATEIGTASTGWNSTTGNFDTAGTGLFADVESLIDGAVTYLEGKVTTLESQINGVGLTADDYDTLVEIGAALTTLNAAAAVTGSVSEKIATEIGTASTGWNSTTGNFDTAGTGLFADVESLIDGAVTYLEGKVTTLESQINGVGLTADDYDTLVEIGAALTTLNAAAAVTGSVSEKIATEIGTASTGWNSTTGNFDTAGTGLFADVESLIDGAVTYLEGKVTTLESQINGVGLTADDYDTLVEIGAALTTLNAAAAVTGSVSEKIATEIGTASTGWNSTTGNFDTAGTGLFADVESLIDGAVTYLEGKVTTLESQINGVGLTADDYDTLVEIGAALTTLNAAAAVTGSVSEKIATEIGTASTGWNSTTGNFDTAGTGLFADVESLIDGAVTYLEGKVTTPLRAKLMASG